MHTESENRDWPSVLVICRIDDVLIVQGKHQMVNRMHGKRIIGLHDLFQTVIQMSVANQDTHPPGCKIIARSAGQSISDCGKAECIIVTPPSITSQGWPCGNRFVDLGEVVCFLAAVVHACTGKSAKIGRYFLLEVDCDSRLRTTAPNESSIRLRTARLPLELQSIRVTSHPALVDVAQ